MRLRKRATRTSAIGYALLTIGLTGAVVVPGCQMAGSNSQVEVPTEKVATVRVIDGDTIVLDGERIRIENIDAPELGARADCASEADLSAKAKAMMETLLAGKNITLQRNVKRPTDFYGRSLAVVYADGHDVAEPLIAAGLARPWRGRSSDWCTQG